MSRHACKPASKIAAFFHTCATCGQPIEPVHCTTCDGTGHDKAMIHTIRPCQRCNGTGVKRWRRECK
jgi:DnaJ-class molecular chaperone